MATKKSPSGEAKNAKIAKAEAPKTKAAKVKITPADRPPNRLEYWREQKKMTRKKLAPLLGITASTLERLENRKMDLTHRYLVKIAVQLDVAERKLLGDDMDYTAKRVPVLEWDQVGRDDKMSQLAVHESVAIVSDYEDVRGTRVVGNAMNRIAPPGTLIIYEPGNKILEDRGRYLIRHNGDVAFREYRSTGGPPRFDADSYEKYDTIFLSAALIPVIGRVRHFIGDL